MRKPLLTLFTLAALALPAYAVQPDEILPDPKLDPARAKSRRSCAAWSARTSRSTIPTPRSPRICVFSCASS